MITLREICEEGNNPSERKSKIKLVCIGDSLTGWNNYAPREEWPVPTFPIYLEEQLGNQEIANFGIAGGTSDISLDLARNATEYLPNLSLYVCGFGTNDLGMNEKVIATSQSILRNIGQMYSFLKENKKDLILFNVPPAKLSMFPEYLRKVLVLKREYHNLKLKEFCDQRKIPLVDVYSDLRDGHFEDGLHTNELGAKLIADKISKRIYSK